MKGRMEERKEEDGEGKGREGKLFGNKLGILTVLYGHKSDIVCQGGCISSVCVCVCECVFVEREKE